jgi:hypothetical protein
MLGTKFRASSPAVQVAKVLVLLHFELLQGSTETLDRLRRQAPAGVSGSMQQKVHHTQIAPPNDACCSAFFCCAASCKLK